MYSCLESDQKRKKESFDSFLSVAQPFQFLISPYDSAPLLDKLLQVCCALINICDSVVPSD